MNTQRITDLLFDQCKRDGLVNPVTSEGAPTRAMVVAELDHARDSAEVDDLSVFVRRLAHALKKRDPENPIIKQAVDYLIRIGQGGQFLRRESTQPHRKNGENKL